MRTLPSGQTQLFIGLHLIHEVTTPQAFDMLRQHGWRVAFPERTFGTVDHIVPTDSRRRPFVDLIAEEMTAALERNCRDFAIRLWGPEGAGSENPYLLQQELQAAMQEGAGIARTDAGLRTCLQTILALKRRADNVHVAGSRLYNPGWHSARDLRFMLVISEAIVRGAIERRESRGAHWRTDFPNADPNFGKLNLIALKDGDAMRITTRPVPEMPDELADLFNGEVRQKSA